MLDGYVAYLMIILEEIGICVFVVYVSGAGQNRVILGGRKVLRKNYDWRKKICLQRKH